MGLKKYSPAEAGLTVFGFLLVAYWTLEAIVHALDLFGVRLGLPESGGAHFGNWAMVLIFAGFIGLFVLAFAVPRGHAEWRSMGLLQGFAVALYFEMFGFPLTIYALSALLGRRLGPTHEAGHLTAQLLGPWLPFETAGPLVMLISAGLMAAAFLLILFAWRRIYFGGPELVTGGAYRYVRHPQYTGFIMITIALLLHWPTVVTLAMWPVLVIAYIKLAGREENDLRARFGLEYEAYAMRTPRFWPRWRKNPES